MPTETLNAVGITGVIMREMRFIQLQVTRRKPIPINHLGILNGFLAGFFTVAQAAGGRTRTSVCERTKVRNIPRATLELPLW